MVLNDSPSALRGLEVNVVHYGVSRFYRFASRFIIQHVGEIGVRTVVPVAEDAVDVETITGVDADIQVEQQVSDDEEGLDDDSGG